MRREGGSEGGPAGGRGEAADHWPPRLSGGTEPAATTLAWAVERLRRHPEVLRALVAEADAGGSELREATILEVQRTRPVIDLVGRQVKVDGFRLGRWTVPKGYTVLVSIDLVHDAESVFPNARAFDPYRFLNARPDRYQWIPFGGGTRRCLGAAFAHMEMNVILRTMLRGGAVVPATERGERGRSRGGGHGTAEGGPGGVYG